MNLNPEAVALSLPLVSMVVETWIKPTLVKMRSEHNFDRNFEKLAVDNLEEYLNRAYRKQLIMNTIVFKNSQKTIDELYIPLSIESSSTDKKIVERIDSFNEKIFDELEKILIVDNAGMGKSTLMKWLFLSVVRENKGIPIFIDLRRLSSDYKIIDFISDELNGINNKIDNRYLMHILERGDFIFFMDGYDEIALVDKSDVTIDIQSFVSKSSNNQFLLSSREEKTLSCFGDFMKFSIVSMHKSDAYKLMRKYDKNGELSKELIDRLEHDSNLELLKEFLKNPLMTSLLYKAYEYKRVIPYKKHIFYRQVYNALFDEHDLSKGGSYTHEKYSNLDIEDFQRVLRSFAFLTMVKGKNSYEKEEFVNYLSIVKKANSDLDFDINAFIRDCIISVPLLIVEGVEYKWVHKSFQEYFSALYVRYDAYEKQSKFLLDIISSSNKSRYFNMMDFYYDLDYKSYKSVVFKYLAEDYRSFYNENIESACLLEIDKDSISNRIAVMYLIDLYPFTQLPANDEPIGPQELFDTCIEKVRRHPCCNRDRSFQGSLCHKEDQTEVYVFQRSDMFSYVELMGIKGDDCIVSTLSDEYYDNVSLADLNCDFDNEFYYIDNSPNNPFNYAENYNYTTQLMVERLRGKHFGFNGPDGFKQMPFMDIDKCVTFLENYSSSPTHMDFEIT